jgi:type IV pilus assembly protein PilA
MVELIVVLFIIGILTAIALPSMLNQTGKAHQAEAKKNIDSILRAQQAFYAEKANFASNFDDIALGNLRGSNTFSTKAYSYTLSNSVVGSNILATVVADTLDVKLKSYSAALRVDKTDAQRAFWNSLICASSAPGTAGLAPADVTACPAGYQELTVSGQ